MQTWRQRHSSTACRAPELGNGALSKPNQAKMEDAFGMKQKDTNCPSGTCEYKVHKASKEQNGPLHWIEEHRKIRWLSPKLSLSWCLAGSSSTEGFGPAWASPAAVNLPNLSQKKSTTSHCGLLAWVSRFRKVKMAARDPSTIQSELQLLYRC